MSAQVLRSVAVDAALTLPAASPHVLPQGMPRVSVIAVAPGSGAHGVAALLPVARDCAEAGVELVVVTDAPEPDGSTGALRWVTVDPELSSRERRRAGMRAATGDIVLMLDERRGIEQGVETLLASVGHQVERR